MPVPTVVGTVEGRFGTLILVLITEVSSIQRSLSTLQYYTGTQNSVLIIDVFCNSKVCNREVPLYTKSIM